MEYKTDIEIAQACKLRPIGEIAARAHVDEKYLEQYGTGYCHNTDPCRGGKNHHDHRPGGWLEAYW